MAKKPVEKKPTGRPSLYTPELAQEVVDGLSDGIPLTVICRRDHMPDDDTIRSWAKEREDLSRAIARARLTGHDAIAWRSRLTARGKGPEEGGDSTGDVQRDKLIIEQDNKLLAKWDPKRYGEKLDLSSSDGSMSPVQLTAEQMENRLAELMRIAEERAKSA